MVILQSSVKGSCGKKNLGGTTAPPDGVKQNTSYATDLYIGSNVNTLLLPKYLDIPTVLLPVSSLSSRTVTRGLAHGLSIDWSVPMPSPERRRAKTERVGTSDAEEVAELKQMMGKSPQKHTSSTVSSTSSLTNRPQWDARPLYNPPGALRGVRPVTKEPWAGVAAADNALRMDFGSRADLGLEEIDEQEWNNNGFVRNARERRRQNDRQAAWDSSVVRHAPAHLRGQKVLRRAEPWSSFHNDDIEELNSIDDTSINEIYECARLSH